MNLLIETFSFLKDAWKDSVRRRARKREAEAIRQLGAEATNRAREFKAYEQAHCNHNFTCVRGGEGGCYSPDFEICQRCQKIREESDVDGFHPIREIPFSSVSEAYPPAGRPEAELYEMPLEELEALARATQ